MRPTLVLLATLLPAMAYLLPPPAHAVQSYDSCTGYIDSLPATIGTQGVWCLRKDLSTAMTSGSAIHVSANNVTIDCNDFKIGGLAAGNASLAIGIQSVSRQNIGIRNCNLRGFAYGISLSNVNGCVVENNRLDSMWRVGIYAAGTNQTVRHNLVFDVGDSTVSASIAGIRAGGEVVGNTVIGVSAGGSTAVVDGILLNGHGSVARGNTVRALRVSGANTFAFGIYSLVFSGARIEHNDISDANADVAFGIGATKPSETFCGRNTINGFKQAMTNCIDTGGNVAF